MKISVYLLTLILFSAFSIFGQQSKTVFVQELAWSPDGKNLSFTGMTDYDPKTDNYRTDIYVVNADGSNLAKLSDIKSFFARFSPDGKKIAFITGKFPESAIYIANADGSGVMKLTRN